jgi:hypothetical protein
MFSHVDGVSVTELSYRAMLTCIRPNLVSLAWSKTFQSRCESLFSYLHNSIDNTLWFRFHHSQLSYPALVYANSRPRLPTLGIRQLGDRTLPLPNIRCSRRESGPKDPPERTTGRAIRSWSRCDQYDVGSSVVFCNNEPWPRLEDSPHALCM